MERKYELKACNLFSKEKAQFLNALLDDSTVRCFCIYYNLQDHNILKNLKSANDKFNYLVRNLVDNVILEKYFNLEEKYIEDEVEIDILLDNRSVKVNYENQLKQYLTHNLKITKKGKKINSCNYYISNNRREIQMADIVANVFWSYLNYPNTENVIRLVNKWNVKTKIYNYPKNYIDNKSQNFSLEKDNFRFNVNGDHLTITFFEENMLNFSKLETYKQKHNNSNIKWVFKNPGLWNINVYHSGTILIQGKKKGVETLFNQLKINEFWEAKILKYWANLQLK